MINAGQGRAYRGILVTILGHIPNPLADGDFDLSLGFHGNRIYPTEGGCRSGTIAFSSPCHTMNADRMTG
jgi:hypothetical protein